MSYSKQFPRSIMDYEGNQRPDHDDVAVEDSITLFVNDMRIATLIATPEMLRELCIGYLITEGVVSALKRFWMSKLTTRSGRRTSGSHPLIKSSSGTKCARPAASCLLYTSPSPRDGLLSRM